MTMSDEINNQLYLSNRIGTALALVSICIQQQHPFNGPLSGTTWVSWYQKGKTSLDLLEQEIVSGNGISWAICKSAPHPRQTTMPPPHQSTTQFLQARCPSCRLTNSVKTLKAL